MPCLPKYITKRLQEDYKAGKLHLGELTQLSDTELVNFWQKEYGFSEDLARFLTAKIQKAVLSPKKVAALKNVLRKDILGRGNLYSSVSIDNAKKMSEKFTIQELAAMDKENRIKALAPYMLNDKATEKQKEKAAKDISNYIEQYKQEGRLEVAEKRLFGTDNTAQAKRAKGKLAEIESLIDRGLLTPENTEDFMRSYVESELGVSIEAAEAEKLRELTERVNEAHEAVGDSTVVIRGKNAKPVSEQIEEQAEYREALADLQRYTHLLETGTVTQDVSNELVSTWANTLLSSAKSLVNSTFYQIPPSTIRFITKRVTARSFASEVANMASDPEHLGLSAKDAEDIDLSHFIRDQLKLEMTVYDRTGEDIARMENGQDDSYLFSQKSKAWAPPVSQIWNKETRQKRKEKLKELRKQELEQSKHKNLTWLKQHTLDPVLNATAIFPKWFAGMTDITIATTTRSDTTVMYAKQVAHLEAKRGLLPEGYSEKARRNELVVDAYSAVPKDPKAKAIRMRAIEDAHFSNNTQNSLFADMALSTRQHINKLGHMAGLKVDVGRAFAPFVRIGSTSVEEKLKYATAPLYVPLSYYNQYKKIDSDSSLSEAEKIAKRYNLTTSYIGYCGAFALALGTMLLKNYLRKPDDEDDDYIPPYVMLDSKEYKIARARGATTDSVRMGGKWIPLKTFAPLDGVLRPMLIAEQALVKNESFVSAIMNYSLGFIVTVAETPVFKQLFDAGKTGFKYTEYKDIESVKELAEEWGFENKSLLRNAANTMGGKIRDFANAFFPPEQKYDFLGNPIERATPLEHTADYYSGFRDAKQTEIISEFNRLYKAGYMPAVSEPTSLQYAKALSEVMPEKEFTEFVQSVKREYGKQVGELIKTDAYKNMSNEDKKKAINNIRDKLMKNKSSNMFEAELNKRKK